MKIYKITSPNTELVYVGMTTKTLKRRLQGHRSSAKMYSRGVPKYCSSFKVLDCGDAVIELIEETDDARREAYWIAELNTCNQMKLMVDWSDPVSVAKYNREYRAANIDAALESDRKYREAHRDARVEYSRQYRKANPEQFIEYTRESREYRSEKVGCDHCGRMVSRRNISTHKKSQLCNNNPLTKSFVEKISA